MPAIPESDIDLFSRETLTRTQAQYQRLRDAGPVVHLAANNLYAVTRHAAVRSALRADDVLISGKGIAANDVINDSELQATLVSDGDIHRRRRAVLTRPLSPAGLEDVKQRIESQADTLVRDLLDRDGFCAVADFASHLPTAIVADLVGLSDHGKERMLAWAAATFNALGAMNTLAEESLPAALEMMVYVQQITPEQVQPDSWASRLLAAGEDGTLSTEEATAMVTDYLAPSLDTTILASAELFWRLATTPGALDRLRADPALVASAVNESVRMASPIRSFTRYAEADFVVEGMTIPAGSRVAILYASANWDERKYPDPEVFQLDRNPRDHVGWGHGAHACAGMHLARLEMEALTRALAGHVNRISVGKPIPILNNVLQGFGELPASFN